MDPTEPGPGPAAPPDPVPRQAAPPAPRRLRRSRRDRVVAGVCGGIGRYLDVDPVLIRLAAVALALSGGAGVLLYLIAWVVVPDAERSETPEDPAWRPRAADRHTVALVAGAGLVVVGLLLLARPMMPAMAGAAFWPLLVVVAGVLIVVAARR